jgi:Ca-activated chloride channel family protein
MRFAQPQVLWVLLAVFPALLGFLFWSWRVKQKLILQFVRARLLPSLTRGVSARRQKLRLALLLAAVAAVFLALARPQWGFAWEEARMQGLDIIIAIDTSRSMLAQDVAPNRIERAKLAAIDLMRLAKTDRLGLVAFAGSAFLQAPLTLDDQAFQQAVEAVSVGIIPQGGTALSAAIKASLASFDKGDDNHKVLILFTDGEDHDADTETLAAAKEAAQAGLRIFTIGVGTPEGELLRVTDSQGNASFVKDDDGNVVKSHLNRTLLQQIATAANGFYLPLQGANPMETLYSRGLAPLPKTQESTRLTRVYRERYHWPLGVAVICLVVELLLPESPRSRRSDAPAAAPLLQTAALIAALLLSRSANASPSSAFSDFQAGDFKAAAEEYNRLAAEKTNDYRLRYDAGTAAYRAKQLENAQKQLDAALNSPDIISDLQAQEHAYYNLGNTLFRLGDPLPDPQQKEKCWQQSIENFGRALHLNTNDLDAKNNLAYVKQKLEELKKQQQQQRQKHQDQDNLEPSEAAKAAKARADQAVKQRQYKQALDIMEASRKQDPTTEYYADYIKRLQEINGVADSASR